MLEWPLSTVPVKNPARSNPPYVTSSGDNSGTHKGEFMRIPSTGKKMSVGSIGIAKISEGQIFEEWKNFDELGMMQQLGVIPTE